MNPTRRVVVCFVLTASIMLLCAPAWIGGRAAAAETASLSGTVVDPSGLPVPEASVDVMSVDGRKVQSILTDVNGAFTIANVAAGQYRVTALRQGFELAEQTVTVGTTDPEPLRMSLRFGITDTTIMVTGSRTEMEIETSPVAVNSVSRSDLEIRNIQLPDQALKFEEGLNVGRIKGANDVNASIGIRGFSNRSSGRVLVLVDGQPVNDATTGGINMGALPVTEVERVEVVRGPFSSLYGGNAMGGVVQFFTRPVTERTIETSAQYGSYENMMYSARISDRLWNRLGYTVSYQRLQVGGYSVNGVYAAAANSTSVLGPLVQAPIRTRTRTGGTTYQIGDQGDNWYNQHALRAKIDYTISGNSLATFQFMQPRFQYGYDSSVPLVFDDAGNPVTSGAFTFDDAGLKRITITPANLRPSGPGGEIQNFFNGSFHHSFGPASAIRISGGITSIITSWSSLATGTSTFVGGPGTTSDAPNRASQAEFQWSLDKPRHRMVFGSEMRHGQSFRKAYDLTNYADRFSRTQETSNGGGKGANLAGYAQDTVALTDSFSIVLGGRYDFWRSYGGSSRNGVGTPADVFPARTANAFSAKAAGIWSAPLGFIVRASVANAFRSPLVHDLFRTSVSTNGSITLANPELKPETMVSWELGVRKQLFNTMEWEASYFDNDIQDLIYLATDLASDPTGFTRKKFNAGQSRARGVEVAFRQRLLSWLRTSQSYTLADSRITKNPLFLESQGKFVPNVPRDLVTFSMIASHKAINASVSGRYMSRAFATDTNAETTFGVSQAYDPFFEMEASGGYEVKRGVSAFISVQNVLNRKYFQFYRAPGRAFSVGLRYRIGGR